MTAKKAFEDSLPFYPYGVQYHRAPTPLPAEWEGDLKEIARAGYTHVQYRPQWRWHERVRGKPTWEDLDRLFDLAATYQLRVVLKPMLETAPDWVFSELDGKRIGFHGVPLDPIAHGAYYVGGWWPCFDNPQVMDAACKFVRVLTSRYYQHPALWFYDAWNEPVSRPLGQCHCRYSVISWRQWLQRRFGTIDRLNAALGKAWTSYETIQAPESGTGYTEMFLWRQWAAYAIAEPVRRVAETIRSVDNKAWVMVHVGSSSVVQDPVCNTSDDFLNAASVDRYGTSFSVPLHPRSPEECAAPDYQSDWVRRVDPQYWCHEFYPNSGNWCRPPVPTVLNRLIWMAIAGGCGGFTFWQYRSERVGSETNNAGLREINGEPTPRSQMADAIAGVLRQYGHRLAGTRRVPSRVALLYGRESDLMGRIQVMNPYWNEISMERGNVQYPYKWALKKAHALYLQNGESMDWVVSGDSVSKYRLLHLTGSEMIDERTANWLRDYVRNGGTLIVEFPFACRDDNTWVSQYRPNHHLEDLLGCREGDRIIVDEQHPETASLEIGKERYSIQARVWRVDLIPQGGQVMAKWEDGNVAGVRKQFGKGKVFSFGVNVSLSYNNDDLCDNFQLKIFRRFLQEAGIEIWPWAVDQKVWVRRRHGKNREIWFVFNLDNKRHEVDLPAEPVKIWQEEGCEIKGKRLIIPAQLTWVAELPVVQVF